MSEKLSAVPAEKNPESEGLARLDSLRADGVEYAQERIEQIEGFDKMDYREKYAALSELLNELNNQENRFSVSYVAAKLREVELEEEGEKADTELQAIRSHYGIAA